jgi:4-amino-4-deoxy-L-arabinose transferase-like glycosyltransferase
MKTDKNWILLALISLCTFILFMVSSTIKPYGFFIDELYFIACSKRLDWGFIDQPPLSIALLSLVRNLLGNSQVVIRILPALSMAATVFVTGLIARRLGGSYKSMLIAGMAVMVTPVYLVFGSYYSMNAYEPIIWTLIMYFTVGMIQKVNPRYWLHIGVLMGIGLEMKHTMLLYGIALIVGLLLTDKRKLLFNKWTLWGGLACFLIILPNLV